MFVYICIIVFNMQKLNFELICMLENTDAVNLDS